MSSGTGVVSAWTLLRVIKFSYFSYRVLSSSWLLYSSVYYLAGWRVRPIYEVFRSWFDIGNFSTVYFHFKILHWKVLTTVPGSVRSQYSFLGRTIELSMRRKLSNWSGLWISRQICFHRFLRRIGNISKRWRSVSATGHTAAKFTAISGEFVNLRVLSH